MHDDDGLTPQYDRIVLRHFETPVSIRELLHSTLDRLLDEMIRLKEPQGAVSVTSMDPSGPDFPFAGRTVLLALDLDPHDDDDWDEGGEGLRDA